MADRRLISAEFAEIRGIWSLNIGVTKSLTFARPEHSPEHLITPNSRLPLADNSAI